MAAPSFRCTVFLSVALAAALAACTQPSVTVSPPVVQAPPVPTPPAPPPPALRPPPLAPLPALPSSAVGLEIPGKIKVALLVPLSGRAAAAGRALQDAAEMAVFDFADENFTLLPFDTEKNGASAAAEQALASGAKLILGPLFGAQTREIADLLARRDRVAISFSNDTAAASPACFVFGFPPVQSIERALRAAREKGVERFAALLPADTLGQRIADMMRRVVSEIGGTIARIELYPSGTEDLSAAVKRVGEFDRRRVSSNSGEAASHRALDATRRSLRLTTRGDVDYQALVISETGLRMRSLAPLLPYYDIDASAVRYIGPPAWDDAALLAEPAMVGAWFAAPDYRQRAEFETRYRALFGRAPSSITTLAYEAVSLAATLAYRYGEQAFARETLLNPDGFAGLNGIFRLQENGLVERGLAVLEIKRNAIDIAVPAPVEFSAPLTH